MDVNIVFKGGVGLRDIGMLMSRAREGFIFPIPNFEPFLESVSAILYRCSLPRKVRNANESVPRYI